MTVPAERAAYVRGQDSAWTFDGEISPPHEDTAIADRAKAAERLRPRLTQ